MEGRDTEKEQTIYIGRFIYVVKSCWVKVELLKREFVFKLQQSLFVMNKKANTFWTPWGCLLQWLAKHWQRLNLYILLQLLWFLIGNLQISFDVIRTKTRFLWSVRGKYDIEEVMMEGNFEKIHGNDAQIQISEKPIKVFLPRGVKFRCVPSRFSLLRKTIIARRKFKHVLIKSFAFVFRLRRESGD